MAREEVRSASKTLGPLLRRRGTSPAVGTALRRAVQALDKVVAAPAGQDSPESIRHALSELRSCMVLCQESTRPADQEQLEGAAKALSFLAPLEAELPPLPADLAPSQQATALQAPSVFQTVIPSSLPLAHLPAPRARIERKARALATPILNMRTVEVQLAGLLGSFDTLHAVLSGATQHLRDLDKAADALQTHLRAIGWLGRERTPTLVKASRESEDAEERLVACAALVHLDAPGGAERSMTVLERSAQGAAPLAPVALTILRTLAGQHFVACVRTVFEKTKSDAARALLLPLLAERGQITPEELLLPLVEHSHEDVAVEAALALAWIGGAQHASALAVHASRAKTPRRASALLFAAAVQGSVPALTEIRSRVRRREEVDELLVDALAITGDDSDAGLLLDLAARPDADAAHVLFAAAHLGCAATVRALPAFADRVPPDVLEEAKRLIVGTGHTAPPNAEKASTRLLRGRPWSVSGMLIRLAAGDETIRSQRRLALELRVRTGLLPPSVLPVFSPTQARLTALANWPDHFAKVGVRLPVGRWYFQGKQLAHKGAA